MKLNRTSRSKLLSAKHVLYVIDEESSNLATYREWVAAQIRQLTAEGARATLLHPAGQLRDLPLEYSDLEAELISMEPVVADSATTISKELAVLAVKYGQSSEFDLVVGFGWTLSRGIAGGRRLSNKYWAFVDDASRPTLQRTWTKADEIDALYSGSRKVFVFDENQRSILESLSVLANGRTYLPIISKIIDSSNLQAFQYQASDRVEVHLPSLADPGTYVSDLRGISDLSKSSDTRFSLNFDGTSERWRALQSSPETAIIAAIPRLKFGSRSVTYTRTEKTIGLVPEHESRTWVIESIVSDFMARGITPMLSSRFSELLGSTGITMIDPDAELKALGFSPESIESRNSLNRLALADAFGTSFSEGDVSEKIRVVLAGADFKFAGDLVELLNDSSNIDLRVDLWENNSSPKPQKSAPFRDWADVIICEFSSFNAIWYSHNKRQGQRLIVRLHGYELLQPWLDQLNIEQVDKVVFVSDFYRRKAIDSKGWPESKTEVISNTVDFADLARDKVPGSEFHLGMAGLVPILKRPDRALDLLEALLQEDERFTLHLRGHSPWNYGWEWKKQAHQAAYRKFYSRIGNSELLRSHISFEAFGPDMAGWFRKIGWVLSPSYRETFHLAPVEGMASGSLPVVWNREGASDIFPAEYVFDDTQAAAGFILGAVGNKNELMMRTAGAQKFARRYSRSTVNEAWIDLIGQVVSGPESTVVIIETEAVELAERIEAHSSTGSKETLLEAVRASWDQNEYSSAISLLDANIKLTANDTDELKQWEHWVRGVFQLTMDLESLIPRRSKGFIYQPNAARVAHVVGIDGLAHSGKLNTGFEGLEQVVIGVGLPAPARSTGEVSVEVNESSAYDRTIKFDGSLRANYYVSQMASELAAEFRNSSVSVAVSSGGLIESLGTLLASRRVGIPFVWCPIGHKGATSFLSKFDEVVNDDPVHSIYQAILDNADGIYVGSCLRQVDIILETDSLSISEMTLAVVRELHLRYEHGTKNDIPPLNILYIGNGKALQSLRTVGQVSLSDSSSLLSELEKVPDAVVFDYGQLASGNTSQLTGAEELVSKDNLKVAHQTIVQARIMGIRTIFLSTTDPTTLGSGKELARKCDVIASNDKASIVSYLRLNPNSNQVAINISGGLLPDIKPSINDSSLPPIEVSAEHDFDGSRRAAALMEGRPFLPSWKNSGRWNDTTRIHSDYELLRYEQNNTSENLLAALWVNAFEISQGRTAQDFATYLMRSAGFAVTHGRSVPLTEIRNATSGITEFVLGQATVRTEEDVEVNGDVVRDLVSLQRISDLESVTISASEAGRQKLDVLDRRGMSYTLDRATSAEMPFTVTPPSLLEFDAKGISIVVATYMGVNRVPTMLESIVDQSLPKSLIQLIVVPNGPDDGTAELVESWAERHGYQNTIVESQNTPGVANARNVGVALASKEFVTFVDDDDFLEPNFLLSLYSRGSESTVVLGRLSDVEEDTQVVNRLTPTTGRVTELAGRVLPLSNRAGALGMNGAKLLPTSYVRSCSYDSSLSSGEDVAFMAQLLRKSGLYVTSAAEIEKSSYMRVLRSNSISRREEDFQFMVSERLDVIGSLIVTRYESTFKGGRGAIDYLTTGQVGFIQRYVDGLRTPEELREVLTEIYDRGMNDVAVLKSIIAEVKRRTEDPVSHVTSGRITINPRVSESM